MESNPVLEAALDYADRGWRVIPLRGKIPIIKDWPSKASTNHEQIRQWFCRKGLNVGIATGQGIAVLDIDGMDGLNTLRQIVAELPRTLTVETGRGVHLYFSCDGPVVSWDAPGLELKGDGRQVVAPPSEHVSGRLYRWVDPAVAMAPLPVELLAWGNGRNFQKPSAKYSDTIPAHLANSRMGRIAERAVEDCHEPLTDEDLLALAETIPNPPDLQHDPWKEVGMAFALDSEASEGAWQAFLKYSKKNAKFNEEFTAKTWEHIKKHPPNRLHFGTLIHRAREADPSFILPSRRVTQLSVTTGKITFPNVYKGKILPTCLNAYIAIAGLGITVRRDLFRDQTEIEGYAMDNQLSEEAVQGIRHLIVKKYIFDPKTDHVHKALIWHACENSYHPIRDYLASLQWDSVPRLDRWLSVYLGAPDTELNSQFGKLILTAAVRRIKAPGTKFDEILVLEGLEGKDKSSAIEILAGKGNFSDQSILAQHDREQQELLKGVWLYEIADLTGMSRADVDKVKAFASRTTDRARPAYGHHVVNRPRECVFFGTTNNKQYLQSQTGNRRWWPVECGVIDLVSLRRDRDQLWAEAAAREAKGESIRLPAKYWAAAAELQEERTEQDPWVDILMHVQGTDSDHRGEYRISTQDLFGKLGLPGGQLKSYHSTRLGIVMRKLGWEGPKPLKINKTLNKGYFRR